MFIAPVVLCFPALRRSVTYGIFRSSGASIGGLERCYKHFASPRRRTPEPANVNFISWFPLSHWERAKEIHQQRS